MKKIVIRFLLPMLSVLLLSACQQEQAANQTQAEQQTFRWKMVTSWPKKLSRSGHLSRAFCSGCE